MDELDPIVDFISWSPLTRCDVLQPLAVMPWTTLWTDHFIGQGYGHSGLNLMSLTEDETNITFSIFITALGLCTCSLYKDSTVYKQIHSAGLRALSLMPA